MIKKILLTFFLSAVVITNLCSITVNADWKQITDTEYEYYKSNGIKCNNGLFKINGIMYCFNESGVCTGKYTGWTKQKNDSDKRRYYVDGFASVDWVKINNKFYYFADNNGFFTGEIQDELKRIFNVEISYINNELIVTFDVENLTNEDVLLGDFKLEKFINDEWNLLTLNDNYCKHGNDAITLLPNVKKSLQINISKMYGTLENGIYRIVDGDVNDYGTASNSFEILLDENERYIINEL